MAQIQKQDLASYRLEDGTAAVKILQELIFYKSEFTVAEHDAIIEIYRRFCPVHHSGFFKIPELTSWSESQRPHLTMSARKVKERPLAEFEAVRQRISENRWFFSKLWDGAKIDADSGSWSLDIQRRFDNGTWAGYVRFLIPIDVPDTTLLAIAMAITNTVPIISGHGGYCFTYSPDRKSPAFDIIFALSRRLKGVDIEDLAATLPNMMTQLKPPCWLNIIGRGSTYPAELWRQVSSFSNKSDIQSVNGRYGILIRLSEHPALFDSNHQDAIPDSYFEFDSSISSVKLNNFGAFSGKLFGQNPDSTDQWLNRYSAKN